MGLEFASSSTKAVPVVVLESASVSTWVDSQSDLVRTWVENSAFSGALGDVLPIPGPDGSVETVLAGHGSVKERARGRFALAACAPKLAAGTYALTGVPVEHLEEECLGWLLAGYKFDRYKSASPHQVRLVAPDGIDARKVEILAQAEALTRDLINTPASDMGPPALEAAARDLALQHGATVDVTTGDALISNNFPMIHAVGRAAEEAPRLIDMRWGTTGPKLTLVGKGVCFDTGGLNLKPGSSMGLMKKDMGGAANVLGLAHAIMALNLPLRLRVLIPAVENSVSGNSFRPQDILMSRKGLSVEINNTDAEGRLVLADALALADEEKPDLIVSMATLTGAARVAVGPDLAPFYTDDDALAQALASSGAAQADPVWRMPFHTPYEKMIEPGIADLDNAPAGSFAGSITAALFLRRFVEETPRYLHFDIYGWQPTPAPARSKGGLGQGTRAILGALPEYLDM